MSSDGVVDRDRQRVYDAEVDAFGGTTMDDPLDWDDVEVLVSAVIADPWWRDLAVTAPTVGRTRVDAVTSRADGRRVRISRAGQDALTVVHELSHHLAASLPWPVADAVEPTHGPRFRATALRVAMVVGGRIAVDQLADAWARHGLSVAAWPFAEPSPRAPRALGGAVAVEPSSGRAYTQGRDVPYRA